MNNLNRSLLLFISIIVMIPMLSGCKPQVKEVVIYTSVDQVYSEKVFDLFEQETGIKIKPVYDIEANKTVGLANKIIAEKNNPQADVFWNGEILQTIRLKEANVLQKVDITSSKDLPANFVDKNGYWYGFGGRARVVIYNKTLISLDKCPKTMKELPKSKYIKKFGMAYPVFGTTSNQVAAMYSLWGDSKAKQYFGDLQKSGVSIVDGNSVVKDYVSQKKLFFGLTDTDDAFSEMDKNKDLGIYFLDQGKNDIGTLIIPNTVSCIKGAPHPSEADSFIEFLLSASVEQKMVDDGWINIPVHEGVKPASNIEGLKINMMKVDFVKLYNKLESSSKDMTDIFAR